MSCILLINYSDVDIALLSRMRSGINHVTLGAAYEYIRIEQRLNHTLLVYYPYTVVDEAIIKWHVHAMLTVQWRSSGVRSELA